MTEQDFLDLINLLDEELFKPFLNDIYKKAQEHYNKLILEGWDSDEALYDVVMKTAYLTLKDAVSIAVFLCSNIEPERPKSKEELRRLLKVIKR
ncbi:hypothetical protein [Carboxydothermus pertinax]|uniref:Uncharacterized protein n=1 Tax=Carboxydothermus pertinax TaxID=870242 RepID=A0A1L8CRL9_9THEO|nr:hypothetical protein [Carboxydothermus pertinax]GAV21575.1 hypothetical protein cpu_00850 [Carboxydothermus pertinax]